MQHRFLAQVFAVSALCIVLVSCGRSANPSPSDSPSCPSCPDGAVCVFDPRVRCDADAGSSCPGVCASGACGGLTGRSCPQGSVCVDDPRDDCAPSRSADCIGVCVQ